MTISQLALWATDNGDPNPLSYGGDPNSPITWDANMVQVMKIKFLMNIIINFVIIYIYFCFYSFLLLLLFIVHRVVFAIQDSVDMTAPSDCVRPGEIPVSWAK